MISAHRLSLDVHGSLIRVRGYLEPSHRQDVTQMRVRVIIRAMAVETHENWLEQHRYLNMEELREHKKLMMRQAA